MNIISLFSGCGGLDAGFEKCGFNIIWANEFDKDIWETYRINHPSTFLDCRSITDIDAGEIPDADGIIGGPPCQSWSAGGSKRGIEDARGKLFWDYIRIINAKNPKFFLAENVKGMLLPRYGNILENFKESFKSAGKFGYDLYFQCVNAADYDVPEERHRVLFIGFRKDLDVKDYAFPDPTTPDGKRINLKSAIGDLTSEQPIGLPNGISSDRNHKVPNHEYMTGGFSPIYMSRNRKRKWDEVSFTIQASGRQAPIHPGCPDMIKLGQDNWIFEKGKESLYRRISVREAARIQTFPDNFEFKYNNINHGYKMIGNAVPVNLAKIAAESVKNFL